MTSANLSILIISFNCWPDLDKCLRSILASRHPYREIVVVDNASVDGTVEKVKQFYPDVRLVANDHNLGHVLAVNQGFRLVQGERVLLLDADTELEPQAISEMSDFLDQRPEVWMVAPRTLNTDGSLQETARNFPGFMSGIFGRQSFLTRVFPHNPFSRRYLLRDNFSLTTPFQVEFIAAACMLFRRTVLERVGGWDEGFTGYWADGEWCKRIQKAGGVIYCVPQAVIVHHEQNKAGRKKNPKRIIMFHRGAFRLYRLHWTWGWADPRTWLTALLLGTRMLLLLAVNSLKKDTPDEQDPLYRNKPLQSD